MPILPPPPEPPPPEPPPSVPDAAPSWRRAGQLGSIGLEMVAAVVAAGYAGAWADRHWHIAPWGTLGGLAIGMAAAGRSVARLIKQTRAGT